MISVAVIGCGVVGAGVVNMLTENRRIVSRSANTQVRLSHVVDVRPVNLPECVTYTHDFTGVLAEKDVRVIVETIGGTGIAYDYTKRALSAGKHVVTSNKALIAAHGEELMSLAHERGVRYLFEASVGGGIPIIRPINKCLTGDKIDRVAGIVNGSTNYILTRMEMESASFAEALREAQLRGYAESNPDADVDGDDARRKLVILAHVAFNSALSSEPYVNTTGIRRVTHKDIALAAALDRRIKLIAHAEVNVSGWYGWVAPSLIPKNHPFYSVNGVQNAISVHGDYVGDVVFQGQGAGSHPTASAIVSDIIDIIRHINEPLIEIKREFRPGFFAAEAPKHRWSARIEGGDFEKLELAAYDVIPGSKTLVTDDFAALITPELTETQWLAAEKRLLAFGIHTGIGLRLYE